MIAFGIENRWRDILAHEFDKPYFKQLGEHIREEYRSHTCYPQAGRIYAAFDNCDFDNLKVVLLGQDPYHGVGQANGLCFSVSDGVAHPPSLANIFKEIQSDLGLPVPVSGNLERWAKQGVLLLNAILTVRADEAGSHQKLGWEKFTDAVIAEISAIKRDVVFLLWGGYARKKGAQIDGSKHLVLTSGHPSPLSANQGLWFGNKHFSKSNAFLLSRNLQPIQW